MANATSKRIRLSDQVMVMAEADYEQNYAPSGMSFTVYINQILFQSLSGFGGFQLSLAAEGTTRPKTGQNDNKSDINGPGDDDEDLDFDQIPDAV